MQLIHTKFNLILLTPNPFRALPLLKCPLGHLGANFIDLSASRRALLQNNFKINVKRLKIFYLFNQ